GGLLMAARVVPQDAGPQHGAGRIQQRSAMHLPGKADAPGRRKLRRVRGPQPAHRLFRSADPFGGVLFRPAVMRARYVERRSGRSDDRLIAIYQKHLDAGRAEVEPEIHWNGPPRWTSSWSAEWHL